MSTSDHTAPVEFRELGRYVGYRFGDDGSVWSRWVRSRIGETWKRLKGRPNDKGYLRVQIKNSETGGIDEWYVHRLVMEAFRGPCPKGIEVRHTDDNDRSNNRLSNLGYATHATNIRDKFRHGTQPFGENNVASKLDWTKVRLVRRAKRRGVTSALLSRHLGVTTGLISQIVRYKIWQPLHRRQRRREC